MDSNKHIVYGMLVLVGLVFATGFSSRTFSNQLLAQKGVPTPGSEFAAMIVDNIALTSSNISDSNVYVKGGEQYPVVVVMRNTSSKTWQPSTFSAVSLFPSLGIQPIYVQSPTPPGGYGIFATVLTAPTTTGSYTGGWQLVEKGLGFFGNLTPQVTINIGGGSVPVPDCLSNPLDPACSFSDGGECVLDSSGGIDCLDPANYSCTLNGVVQCPSGGTTGGGTTGGSTTSGGTTSGLIDCTDPAYANDPLCY